MRLNQKEEIQSHVRCSTAQDFENGSNASKTACWCLARRKFEDGVHRGVVGLTCLSNLPGLVNAGSRISGKFVAAIRIIPYRRQVNALGQEQVESATHQPMTEEKKNLFFFTSFCSKPSISTRSWCNVFFVCPSHCFLVDPIASISSIKMMHGAYV